MPGQEERIWREEKRRGKQRVARHNRAIARRKLQTGQYEEVLEDVPIPLRQQVAELHIGRNKPRSDSDRQEQAELRKPD